MEEYEVELIDYLRVIWKRKWIILGCLVVALAAAAAVMWTRPVEYSGEITYRLREYLASEYLDEKAAVESGVSVLLASARQISLSDDENGLRLEASAEGDQVTILLRGSSSSQKLQDTLDGLGVLMREQLSRAIKGKLDVEIAKSEFRLGQLASQRELLKGKITEIETPDIENPIYQGLALKIVDLEGRYVEEQVHLDALRAATPGGIFVLEEVKQPFVFRVSPNRRLSLAVAAVLGLFVGVLLAFFVHYLVTVREREKKRRAES